MFEKLKKLLRINIRCIAASIIDDLSNHPECWTEFTHIYHTTYRYSKDGRDYALITNDEIRSVCLDIADYKFTFWEEVEINSKISYMLEKKTHLKSLQKQKEDEVILEKVFPDCFPK